jgi:hypothetical protein
MLKFATLLFAAALAGTPDLPDAAAAARGFEHLKDLAGTWTATGADGSVSHLTYEVIAGGTAVTERCEMVHDGQPCTMLTVYHLDGARLLLTHYCMAGNQPRMEARRVSDVEIAFEMVDATGLDTPDEGHMARAVWRFDGPDRFSTEWTFRSGDKDVFTEKANCTRDAAR